MALLTIAVGTAKRRHDRRDYPVSLLQVIEIPVSPVIGPGPAPSSRGFNGIAAIPIVMIWQLTTLFEHAR
jgi:hypothetical protein